MNDQVDHGDVARGGGSIRTKSSNQPEKSDWAPKVEYLDTTEHIDISALLDPCSHFSHLEDISARVIQSYCWQKNDCPSPDDHTIENPPCFERPLNAFDVLLPPGLEYCDDVVDSENLVDCDLVCESKGRPKKIGCHLSEPDEWAIDKKHEDEDREPIIACRRRRLETTIHALEVKRLRSLHDIIGELVCTLHAMELMQQEHVCRGTINILVETYGRSDIVELISISIDDVRALVGLAKSLARSESIIYVDFTRLLARLLAKYGAIQDNHQGPPANPDQIFKVLYQKLRQGFGDDDLPTAYLDLLSALLGLSTMSYVGSHCTTESNSILATEERFGFFDRFNMDMNLMPDYCLRQRELACLQPYIGAPVWVFSSSSNVSTKVKLLTSIEQFADIWGPVFAVPSSLSSLSQLISLNLEGGILHRTTSAHPIIIRSRDQNAPHDLTESIYPLHFTRTGPVRGTSGQDATEQRKLWVAIDEGEALPAEFLPFPSTGRLLIGKGSDNGVETEDTVADLCPDGSVSRRASQASLSQFESGGLQDPGSTRTVQQWLELLSLEFEHIEEQLLPPQQPEQPSPPQSLEHIPAPCTRPTFPPAEPTEDATTARLRRLHNRRRIMGLRDSHRGMKLELEPTTFRVADEDGRVFSIWGDAELMHSVDTESISTSQPTNALPTTFNNTPHILNLNSACTHTLEKHGRANALDLHVLGTSKRHYLSDSLQMNFSGGQWVNVGMQKAWKLKPEVKYKTMLTEICSKPRMQVHIRDILDTRVGLEWSACTGNAERITLWDTLRLAYTTPTDRIALRNAYEANDSSVFAEYIADLESTGLDEQGRMRIFWPRSKGIPHILEIKDLPNWSRMLKDTRESACFAVMSDRCLTFTTEDAVAGGHQISGTCANDPDTTSQRGRHQALATTINVHPSAFVSSLPSLKTKIRLESGDLEIRSTITKSNSKRHGSSGDAVGTGADRAVIAIPQTPEETAAKAKNDKAAHLAHFTSGASPSTWIENRFHRGHGKIWSRELFHDAGASNKAVPVIAIDRPAS